ncbi:MAG TPA: hypothetical protein VMR77_04285 [Patescibacteria group bacterium]|nr:hypothetical protein [Patescibacteria group bacterium]
MLSGYLYFSDTNKRDIKTEPNNIKVTDILEGGREIFSDWIEKEATKVLEARKSSKVEKRK